VFFFFFQKKDDMQLRVLIKDIACLPLNFWPSNINDAGFGYQYEQCDVICLCFREDGPLLRIAYHSD